LVGTGVKVTDVPVQIVFADGVILTAGTNAGFTVMVTLFEVAVGWLVHPKLEVITQLTTSELAKVELV
jgi:hypothetical protein